MNNLSSTERCECCDLPTYSCGKAKEAEQRQAELDERTELVRSGGWVPANYRGPCAQCGEWFRPGTLIRHRDDPPGWIAECCADGAR